MRFTSRVVLLLSIVAAVLGLAACSKHQTQGEAGIATQTLYLGNAAEPQDLDPGVIYAWTDSNIDYALFEGLTLIDEATTQPVPAGAESWDVSPDGLVYTFHLRPTAKWSNGDPVTADDYVYSLHRTLSPNFGASYSYMLWYVKNAEAYNDGKITDFSQVGIKALSPLVLQLTLGKPTPYLPSVVSHTTWLPVHQAVIETYGKMDEKGTKWTRPGNLVGNGPFVLKDWVPNSKIVVEKNPYYWDQAKVRLNRIEFFPIESNESSELSYRSGQLQVTYEIPTSKVAVYKRDHPDQVKRSPDMAIFYLFINTKRPPFDNPKVRLALSMAVDRERISKDVLQGLNDPAYTFVPPDCGGYTSHSHVVSDFDAARKLLAEAGYAGGKGIPAIEVLCYSKEAQLKILETIQQEWARELGVQMTISPLEQKTLFANQQSGNYTIAFSSWIADYADPSTFLDTLHTGNGNNWAFWSNAEFDRLDDAAASDPDNARRLEDLQQAEAILLHEAPLIPIYYGERWFTIQPYVKGWPASRLGFHRFKNVYLEK